MQCYLKRFVFGLFFCIGAGQIFFEDQESCQKRVAELEAHVAELHLHIASLEKGRKDHQAEQQAASLADAEKRATILLAIEALQVPQEAHGDDIGQCKGEEALAMRAWRSANAAYVGGTGSVASGIHIWDVVIHDQIAGLRVVARHVGQNTVDLGFRGTVSDAVSWAIDLDYTLVPLQNSEKHTAKVHRGFQIAYMRLREPLLNWLKQKNTKYINICGHSLGGALATLAAVDLSGNPSAYSVQTLTTFGCPRVGDEGFGQVFANLGLDRVTERWVNFCDPVTKTPLEEWGYKHVMEATILNPACSAPSPSHHAMAVGAESYLVTLQKHFSADVDPEHELPKAAGDQWFKLGAEGGGIVDSTSHTEKQHYEIALKYTPDIAQSWYNLGVLGGGTVDGTIHTRKQCYEIALRHKLDHALSWYNLGVEGGGTVDGTSYTQKQCYEIALKHKPDIAHCWYNLGVLGGGTVDGISHTQKQCFEIAVKHERDHDQSWYNLGVLGGGTVDGTSFTEKQCYEITLRHNADDAHAWYNLGVLGGGTVDSTPYTQKQCYETALRHKSDIAESWYNLGVLGGGTVEGTSYTEKQCFEIALKHKVDIAQCWYNLGMLGGGTVDGTSYTRSQCYDIALKLNSADAHAW